MGNRAVITFDDYTPEGMGVYVHWNGGRDSIEAFLKATRILMGDRLGDDVYARARFVQVVGTFFSGNLSFGLGQCKELDCTGDNGVYIIDSKTMTIKGRAEWGADRTEQEEYDTNEMADQIIALLNASYTEENKDADKYCKTAMLPTAAEFDAAEAK